MSFSKSVAHFVTHKRALICSFLALFLIAAAAIVIFYCKFNSEILDLLPGKFPSVQTLKIYTDSSAESRQLTTALLDETGKVDLDGFRDFYAERLKAAPWVERFMARSPADDPNGFDDLKSVAIPMMLNLPPSEFQKDLAALAPDKIRVRLNEFHSQIAAGSFKAEIQLELDPTGILLPALKPLAGSLSKQASSDALTSPDGTTRLVLIVPKQTDLGAHAAQDLMKTVRAFNNKARADWLAEGNANAPQILVTGRIPYIAEMSLAMHNDVILTLILCVTLVSLIFYIGFRRIRPLIAIILVLLLCCAGAVAIGALIYHSLNGIAIGCCSILVGLDIDFGILFYGTYQAARATGLDHESSVAAAIQRIGRGVLFGALTTATAFATFLLSECKAFEQLGVLVAAGILLAAIFMGTVFFVLLGANSQPARTDWIHDGAKSYVALLFRRPKQILAFAVVVLLALTAVAILSFKKLDFQANPKSLEPKHSVAGDALRTIQKKFPIAKNEPIFVLCSGTDAADFSAKWHILQTHWETLVANHEIASCSTPAPLALNPANIAQNRATLEKFVVSELSAARVAYQKSLDDLGFKTASFKNAFSTFDALTAIANNPKDRLDDWRTILPKNSSWRFLIDHYFTETPLLGVATVSPNHTIANHEEKVRLTKLLQVPGIDIHIAGWSYTLADLVPWSHAKLKELSIVMLVFNTLLLIALYRRVAPLLVLMISLSLSIGALLACLEIFAIPLNLFNVLAFPLVLGIGIDYGIYILLAFRSNEDRRQSLITIVKPVFMSGMATIAGFGALGFSSDPALAGLGEICAIGIACCLFSTFCFILPTYLWRNIQ